MSHAAAAFILQKSNEVLSMIKAFKRKANNNANDVTTTQNDAVNTAVPQLKRTSAAVNCMNLRLSDDNDNRPVLLFDNFVASNSNIYTEIDLRDVLPTTKNLVTEPKPTTSTDSISSDILRFLFNDSNDLQFQDDHSNQSETNQIDSYVNESVTSQAITQMEMNVINAVTEQNLYDIDSIVAPNVATKMIPRELSVQCDELMAGSATNSDSSLKSNAFFANISKSLKYKLKHMMNEEIVSNESMSKGVAKTVTSDNQFAIDDIEKASLKKRIKFKLKTGLHLFKDTKVRDFN